MDNTKVNKVCTRLLPYVKAAACCWHSTIPAAAAAAGAAAGAVALTLVTDLLLLALSAHHELDEALCGVLISHRELKALLPGGVQAWKEETRDKQHPPHKLNNLLPLMSSMFGRRWGTDDVM